MKYSNCTLNTIQYPYPLPNRCFLNQNIINTVIGVLLFALLRCVAQPVWPDWAIYWTFGKFLKHLATINLPKSPHSLAIFVKMSKPIINRVKSFLGNFYRHFAISFWSHFAQSHFHTELFFINTTRQNFIITCQHEWVELHNDDDNNDNDDDNNDNDDDNNDNDDDNNDNDDDNNDNDYYNNDDIISPFQRRMIFCYRSCIMNFNHSAKFKWTTE